MHFVEVLTKYRYESYSEADKGTRFEKLIQAFLKTSPDVISKAQKAINADDPDSCVFDRLCRYDRSAPRGRNDGGIRR